ncbi:hypothetical protein Acr_02g0005870 [Actinidia rufa]|uniref:Uncharacterized protein n=1 Tax=Actinidia rufa TaxID=165716 RepID=A0A7J0E9K5_9ERIC|nr:hypothetical protein Acr_02g0005870 [Actinidia rufa]
MPDGTEECKFAVLEECVEAMKLSVEDDKKCYTEEVDNLNKEMLVVDGCFIIELFYRDYLLTHPKEETNEERNEITKEMPKEEIRDPVFGSHLMLYTVLHDLLLLANQLPFRVLDKARFEIPTWSLSNSTEPFLRNLIAFEQCFPGVSCYFTSYAFLMDMLVNFAKDVEVLQKAGIIENYLGADQDASDLFNKLSKEVL